MAQDPETPLPRRRLRDGWYKNYKHQVNSMTTPLLIMAVSGSHIAWGITSPQIRNQEWHLNTLPNEQVIVIIVWYIGAIIGSVLLNFLHLTLSKRLIYFIGSLLCVLSSALMIAFPQHMIALIVARLTAGLAHGLIFVLGIMHGASNASNDYRVNVVGAFSVMISISMIITPMLVMVSDTTSSGPSNQSGVDGNLIVGIINASYSVLAIICIPIYYYDSVVDLVEKGEDQKAAVTMARLRTVGTTDEYLQQDLADVKAMVEEDKDQNISPLQEGNQRAMGLILLAKLLGVLTMNYMFNMIKTDLLNLTNVEYVSSFLPYVVRAFVLSFVLLLVNMVGRKLMLTISGGLAGVTILILAIFVTATDNLGLNVLIVIMIFEFVTAIGVVMIPDILMSEAFSLKKRIASGMFANIIEFVLNIMIVGITYDIDLREYRIYILYASGALVFLISVALYIFLPKTDRMHIRHARAAFKSRENTNSGFIRTGDM